VSADPESAPPADGAETPPPAPASEPSPPPGEPSPPKKSPWPGLIRIGILLAGVLLIAELTGIRGRMADDPRGAAEDLRRLVADAGPWGWILFVVAFCVGELAHVPGLVFVLAAVLAWGRVEGGALGYAGGVASVAFSFIVVRSVGGKALDAVQRPWARRLLDRLESRPVLIVAVLRMVMIMSPPLNYALAMSPIRFRDYVAGSAIGLLPPMLVAILAFDWVIATFL